MKTNMSQKTESCTKKRLVHFMVRLGVISSREDQESQETKLIVDEYIDQVAWYKKNGFKHRESVEIVMIALAGQLGITDQKLVGCAIKSAYQNCIIK